MNVVHIGTFDTGGGAARAAFRLHSGLRAAGHESRMLVGWKAEASPDIESVMQGSVMRRVVSLLDRTLSLQYAALPWRRAFLDHPFVRSADIIHLHNLHGGYFPYRILPELGRIAPVVWSLHDMWGMTGHCAYSYDCDRWKTGCGTCPILDEYPAISVDTTALHWRIKDRTYRRTPLTVVTGSTWMAAKVKDSPLLNRFAMHTIPYGTDLNVFRPVDTAQARAALRIPDDVPVILMFAVKDPRKGGAYLLEALEKLGPELRPWLVIAGNRLASIPAGCQVRHVGYVDSDDLLNLCYGAADVFVLAALAENAPLSLLDARAAGAPTVAFDVGGIAELVQHLETGCLVTDRSADGLAQAIRLVLKNPELRGRMRQNARRVAEREDSNDTYTKRYLALYGEVTR